MTYEEFANVITAQGRALYRDMPWRRDVSPYAIFISEMMLQQTQVDRVIPKYHAWMERFPTAQAVANAPLSDILTMWQGLGYNRRAKYVHQSMQMIVDEFGGVIPRDSNTLLQLPGIGVNTAGAVQAYAYNIPALFIETNVRTVYMHHFFSNQEEVSDERIKQVLNETMDSSQPRKFYWALMDYGAWLKKQGVRNTKSAHYKQQSRFEGSLRQMRGIIMRQLAADGHLRIDSFAAEHNNDERINTALSGLERDGMIVIVQGAVCLPGETSVVQ